MAKYVVMAIAVTASVSLTTILTTKQATNNGNNIGMLIFLFSVIGLGLISLFGSASIAVTQAFLGIRWIIAAVAAKPMLHTRGFCR